MATEDQQHQADDDGFDAAFEKEADKRGQPAISIPEDDNDDAAGAGGAKPEGDEEGEKAVAQPPAAVSDDPWKDAPPKLRQMYIDAEARAAAMEHSARSQAGRVSALQRKVDDLQSQTRSSKPGAGEGPAADGEDDDELKSLEQDFPSVVKLVRKTVKQEVDPVRENVRERDEREAADREQTRIAAAFSTVAKVHPDYDQIRRSPAYAQWLGGQAPGVQQLAYSEDPRDAIELFSLFKQKSGQPKHDGGNRGRLVDAAVETPSKGAPRRSGINPDDFDGNFELQADRINKRNHPR